MSNKVKAAGVPKLRFPEFRDAGEWKLTPLSRVATRGKQKNRDQKIDRVLTNSAEFGVMDQRDYFDKDIATQGKLEGYFVVELGDYVYNPRISATAPVGPISKNNLATGVMSALYTVFKFKKGDNDFYSYYFKTVGWHTYMRQASSTGARHDRMATSSGDFMAMPVPTTSLEEQQKITDCLSSLDELIAAQARKVHALKTHKKALMQQLFPRENETQPSLRFPEFLNAGEWIAKRLSGLIDLISGMHLSPGEYSAAGEVPYFTGPSDFTNDLQNVTKWTKRPANVSEAGDTLITVKGSGVGEIWCSELTEVAMGRQLMAVRTKYGSSRYIFQFLLTKRSRFKDLGSGNLIPGLSRVVILELEAPFPSPPEQERIGDCLTSLDDVITAATEELEGLKTYKKGLMQQLFPYSDEVEA
jgi:type I restriction enzyme, S subunit